MSIFTAIIIITMVSLRIYTRHGQAYPLPDFTGLAQEEVQELAKGSKLRVQIIDSVYNKEALPGSVVDQIPKPGFRVKQNRTVFLTINAMSPEQVIVPKLRDISFRQAKVLIENSGMEIGSIIYKPSEYNDLVLDVVIDSTLAYEGDKFPKSSEVELVVGKTSPNEKTQVPNIIGMTLTGAKSAILDAMLNQGVIIYDETILDGQDSLNARIWRQRPDPRINSTTELGTSIDMWLTIDELKVTDAID